MRNFLYSLRLFGLLAIILIACGSCTKLDPDCFCDKQTAESAATDPVPSKLHRGVNLSRWWEDDRSRVPRSSDLKRLHELGFDFVRLPISPTRFLAAGAERRKNMLHDLRCDITLLLNQNFKVVLDLHVGEDDGDEKQTPEQISSLIETFWDVMKPALAGLPPQRVLISIYNEPSMETCAWWKLQGKLIVELRKIYPKNTLVVTPSPAGGWWELENLAPYNDHNLIYDVHFYEPMIFTHQGAEWLQATKGQRSLDTVTYPSANIDLAKTTDPFVRTYAQEKWNRAALASLISRIAKWKKATNAEVDVLEFGVYRNHVDDDSRLNWLRDTRAEFEKQGLPWALWEYRGPFGLVTPWGSFDEAMANALGLGHTAVP